ncbi:Ribulose-5-phosphate 4-epimerase/Fuculose-1-phosphate aldolase [Kaistia soli DSM 19436]|uniref:Ribulose-5-phosphate 4-epimerase/Fuculose-1-phosphate aldolase n=1 Tax=Kaistia soli DSM 19436 TaxID=1122133 RepID=A0A1M5FYG6_9HYPH|nr:class II aldolase/adducin family protein [Kaistia soli]SHF96565.1 Ribulose-5-phosphate 4-epimerase/Fuculose-1-phosphate aldolase [Kaistia soli DSM 19436]
MASFPANMDPALEVAPTSEAALRIQLAACFRLVAHFGMDDLIYNHISVRLPGPEHHFLINPYGLLFSEIDASCFVKIDLDGNKVEPSDYEVNQAGFIIHSAIHLGREDALCVLHTHSEAATAISALEEGLLPLSQFAMRYQGHMGLHDYEGVAIDTDERQRLIDDIGTHNTLVLRNHGVLTVGRTIQEAFILMYYFEKAARVQLLAQSAVAGGAHFAVPATEVTDKAARQFNDHQGDIRAPGSREWPAFIRLLDRIDPSYRN